MKHVGSDLKRDLFTLGFIQRVLNKVQELFMSLLTRKKSLISTAIALSLGFSVTAFAAEEVAKEEVKKDEKIEKITVTGSRIKRPNYKSAAPMVILDRLAIERTGAQTVFEVLKRLPSVGGSLTNTDTYNNSIGAFNAVGAQNISLRGMGSNGTLILVNGRRRANYGLIENREALVSSLDGIPLDSIERIEVLKAGASSIYGSDAMAGVINIILRKDYEGRTLTVDGNMSTEGDAETVRVSYSQGIAGIGGADNNLTIGLEYFNQPSLNASARDPQTYTNRGVPGTLIGGWENTEPDFSGEWFQPKSPLNADACDQIADDGSCQIAAGDQITMIPEVDKLSLTLGYTHELSDSLDLFADASYSSRTTTSSQFAKSYNWYGYGDAGEQLQTSFADVGNISQETEANDISLSVGLQGYELFGNLDWEVVLSHSSSDVSTSSYNQIMRSGLELLQKSDFTAPGAMSAELITALRAPAIVREGKNTTSEIEFHLSGPIMELPAGELAFAVGGNYRRQTTEDAPDSILNNPDETWPNNFPVLDLWGQGLVHKASRDSGAVFGEISLPAIENVQINFSARVDWDETFGTHTSPSVSARWDVLPDMVGVRASFTEGYRAPSLSEFGRPTEILPNKTKFNTPPGVTCEDRGPWEVFFPNECYVTTMLQDNPDIQPETSEQLSVGVFFSPAEDLSLSVDYFNIERENEIRNVGLNEAIIYYPEWFGTNEAGEINTATKQYGNVGYTANEGVDYAINWTVGLGEYGELETNLSATYLLNNEENWDPLWQPAFEGQEQHSHNTLDGYRGNPKWRGLGTISWFKEDWTSTITYHYRGKYDVASNNKNVFCDYENPGTNPSNPDQGYKSCYISAYSTFDMNVRYTGFENIKLTVNVLNVFDSVEKTSEFVGQEDYKGIGRMVGLKMQYDF